MKLSQGTIIFEEDLLTEAIRREVRSFIERIVLEELAATLGAGPYPRTEERQGYRHGFEHRQISTSLFWKSTFVVPIPAGLNKR